MTDIDISRLCSRILAKLGFEGESFPSLMEGWKAFVSECGDGYSWDYSEYRNEIRVRYLIQQLLKNERIANSREYRDLLTELKEIDQTFKSLLQSDVVLEKGEFWWDRGVLKRAGEAYCLYMYDAHQILVENVEV